MKQYRVVEKIVKNQSVFYPQVLVKFLFIFSSWKRISTADVGDGTISLLDNYEHGYNTLEKAWKRTVEYQESLVTRGMKIYYQ